MGRNRLSLEYAAIIAGILGVEVGELLDDEPFFRKKLHDASNINSAWKGDWMTEHREQVLRVMKQFGEYVPIKVIAQYLQDEFSIPYDEAVKLINELTEEWI